MVKIHQGPLPVPVIHIFHLPFTSPVLNRGPFKYFGGGGAGAGAGFGEHDAVQAAAAVDPASLVWEGLPEEVVQQSSANISSRIFKKIKALVHNNSLLADALQTSSELEKSFK